MKKTSNISKKKNPLKYEVLNNNGAHVIYMYNTWKKLSAIVHRLIMLDALKKPGFILHVSSLTLNVRRNFYVPSVASSTLIKH